MTPNVHILALVKGQHRYVFVYDAASGKAMVEHLQELGDDPATGISPADAAALARRVAMPAVEEHTPETVPAT